MPYGEIRVDTITFTNGGVDKSITVSGLFASTSGNLTVTGTVSGVTATFATGTFSSRVSGLTVVGTTGTFTSLTGTTITGANASFVSGVFTNQISGATVTGTTANFTSGNITALNVAGQIRIDNNTTDPNNGSSYLFQTSGIGWTIASTNVSINTGASGSRQERLRIDSSGRVGIGTSSPQATLNVAGQIRIDNNTTDPNDGSSYLFQTSGIGWTIASTNVSINTGASGSRQERLRIDSSGRVGIGTSSPGYLLDVNGGGTIPAQFSATVNWNYAGLLLRRNASNVSTAKMLSMLLQGDTDSDTTLTNHLNIWGTYSGTPTTGSTTAGLSGVMNLGAPNALAFHTNTSERLRIDSSGRVGIGTTSPNTLLHVAGNATIGAADASPCAIELGQGATGDRTSYIDLVGDTTYTDYGLRFQREGGANGSSIIVHRGTGNIAIKGTEANNIVFSTNDAERLRIDSSGNLLVGLSNSVTIASALSKQQIFSTNQHAFSWLRGSNDSYGVNVLLAKSRNASPGSRTILQNNDEVGTFAFVADDGTDLESSVAAIACAIDGTPGANDTPGRLVFCTTADGASSPMERMRIKNNGLVCIACTDRIDAATNASGFNYLPGDFVCVATTVSTNACAIFNKTNSAAGLVIAIRYNGVDVGSITNTSTSTAYNTSSDYRLKENVVPLTGAIDRINQLKPSQFNFIADPDRIVDGFLAHEAQEVVPECVTGEKDAVDDEGNPIYQGIDQSKMVPLAIAAIQEAIAKIETLEAKVAALEGV